eukprot:s5465_g3.t19
MCARWRQFELMPPEMGSSLSEARMVASCRQWRHPLASSRVLLCSHILSQQAFLHSVPCRVKAFCSMTATARQRLLPEEASLPVRSEGSGPETLFFVHGWPDDAAVWQAQPSDVQQSYSSKGYDFEEVADMLAQTIRHHCKHRVILVLHDWGCPWGFMLQHRHPGLVASIIALDVGHPSFFGWKDAAYYFVKYQAWLVAAYLVCRLTARTPFADLGQSLGDRMARVLAQYIGRDHMHVTGKACYPYFYFFTSFGWWPAASKPSALEGRALPSCPCLFMYGQKFGRNKPFLFHTSEWEEHMRSRTDCLVVPVDAGHYLQALRAATARRKSDSTLPSTLRGMSPLHRPKDIGKLFEEMDADGDGFLGEEDLTSYLRDYLRYGEAEVMAFLHAHQQDGRVDLPAFKRGLKELQPYAIHDRFNKTIVRKPGAFGGLDCVDFHVEDCSGCTCLVCEKSSEFHADGLVDCRLVIGPCENSTFVRNCENCTFWVATKQFRVRECINCTFYLHCHTEPIIESSKDLRVAPFCAEYPGLSQQFREAKFDPTKNFWNAIYDFTGKAESSNWQIPSLDACEKLIVSFRGCTDAPDGPAPELTQALLCADPLVSGESQGQSMANIPQTRPALPGKPGRQRLQRLMSDAANEDVGGRLQEALEDEPLFSNVSQVEKSMQSRQTDPQSSSDEVEILDLEEEEEDSAKWQTRLPSTKEGEWRPGAAHAPLASRPSRPAQQKARAAMAAAAEASLAPLQRGGGPGNLAAKRPLGGLRLSMAPSKNSKTDAKAPADSSDDDETCHSLSPSGLCCFNLSFVKRPCQSMSTPVSAAQMCPAPKQRQSPPGQRPAQPQYPVSTAMMMTLKWKGQVWEPLGCSRDSPAVMRRGRCRRHAVSCPCLQQSRPRGLRTEAREETIRHRATAPATIRAKHGVKDTDSRTSTSASRRRSCAAQRIVARSHTGEAPTPH